MHHKVSFHNCPNRQSDNYCRGKNNGASQNLWKISQHTSFFWFPAKLGIILVKDKPVSLIANKVSIREVGFYSRLSRTLSHLSRKLSRLSWKLFLLGRKLFFLGENHFLSGNYLFRLICNTITRHSIKKTAENCFLYGLNGFTEKPKSFIPKHQQQL